MRRVTLIILPLAALIAGCGKLEVKASGAEQAVVDVVSGKTGFHPNDVKCPSGVEAKVGKTFDCHFTGPNAVPYTAHMRITKIKGNTVDFFVQTAPS